MVGLVRLAVSSECTARDKMLDISLGTILAENTLITMDLGNEAVIPHNLTLGRLINFSEYNIDIGLNDGTFDGKHRGLLVMPRSCLLM